VYHPLVIRRFYVHNFRCLENFELPISGHSSALLIGKNGSGKTSVGLALQVLQKIARGTNRVGDLVRPKDFARGRTDVPMRFEIQVELGAKNYGYSIAIELPQGGKEPRVLEETVRVGGESVYTREVGRVYRQIDLQLLALPIIQRESAGDPIFVLKEWLARMLILRPMPTLISGDSNQETLEPNPQVTDFGAWFSGLVAYSPSVYAEVDQYLKQVMPDLIDIKNPVVGKDARSLVVQFSNDQGSFSLPFEDLSDGEKCYMICALVLAANHASGPAFCFWDEPDNYLALSEVGHLVMALRKAFQFGGQFIATSHNPEAIRRFSDENTFVLYRSNHLEPTRVRPLKDIHVAGDLVGALIRDDIDP
jgi:energy-coupling factor transporter ATP-binding protein EcfA2